MKILFLFLSICFIYQSSTKSYWLCEKIAIIVLILIIKDIADSASFVNQCLVAGGQDFKGFIINSQGIIDIFPNSQCTRDYSDKDVFLLCAKEFCRYCGLKKMKAHDDSLYLISGFIQVMSFCNLMKSLVQVFNYPKLLCFSFLSYRKFFWRILHMGWVI